MSRACRRAWTLALLASAGVVAATPAFAQTTVEQLVAIAIDRAPAVREARAAAEAAHGQMRQAGLRPNPTLAGGYDVVAGGGVTSAALEWPLRLFDRRGAALAVARGAADVAEAAVRDRARLAAASVRDIAGRLLAARRMVEIASEAHTAAVRLREILDRRVLEGGATKLDANLAAVEALRLEAELGLARGEVAASTIELRNAAGLPLDAPLVLADSLDALARLPVAVPRLDEAVDARPDVQRARGQLAHLDAAADMLRREARTDVTLLGGYTRGVYPLDVAVTAAPGAMTPATPPQMRFHAATFGARVNLPILDRNQGRLAANLAERAGAMAALEWRQRDARAEIEAAQARHQEALRAADLYATRIRDLTRQNVDVLLEGYDLGRFRLVDVLAEQRRYLEVEAAHTSVLSRAYQARVALLRARGEQP